MPIVTDVLSKIKANVIPGNLPKLERRLSEATEEQAQKRAALDAALADDPDGSAVMSLEDQLSSVSCRVLNLTSALATARQKAQSELAEQAAQGKEAERQRAIAAAEARYKALTDYVKAAQVFAGAYNAVLKANSELLGHLPTDHDSFAALTNHISLETSLRKELVRVGLPWCFPWPYGSVSIPELLPLADGALQVVRDVVANQ